MAKTLDQRLAAAKLIKDETIPNANTAPRVGGAMEDINNAWNEELGEINVTTAFPPTSGYHTPETARAAVPDSYKRKGRTISYQTAAGTWVKEQYRGDSTAAWTTASNWFPILMAADQNVYNVTTQNPLAAGEYYNPTTARAAVPNQIRKLNLGLKYLSGYKEIDTLTITGPALTDGSISIFLNGVKNTASPVIYAGDTAIDIATKIRLMTWAGWTVGGTPGTAVVTFTRTTYDPVSAPTFSSTAGITANFVRTSTGQTTEWIHEEFIGPSTASWTTATNWRKLATATDLAKIESDLNQSVLSNVYQKGQVYGTNAVVIASAVKKIIISGTKDINKKYFLTILRRNNSGVSQFEIYTALATDITQNRTSLARYDFIGDPASNKVVKISFGSATKCIAYIDWSKIPDGTSYTQMFSGYELNDSCFDQSAYDIESSIATNSTNIASNTSDLNKRQTCYPFKNGINDSEILTFNNLIKYLYIKNRDASLKYYLSVVIRNAIPDGDTVYRSVLSVYSKSIGGEYLKVIDINILGDEGVDGGLKRYTSTDGLYDIIVDWSSISVGTKITGLAFNNKIELSNEVFVKSNYDSEIDIIKNDIADLKSTNSEINIIQDPYLKYNIMLSSLDPKLIAFGSGVSIELSDGEAICKSNYTLPKGIQIMARFSEGWATKFGLEAGDTISIGAFVKASVNDGATVTSYGTFTRGDLSADKITYNDNRVILPTNAYTDWKWIERKVTLKTDGTDIDQATDFSLAYIQLTDANSNISPSKLYVKQPCILFNPEVGITGFFPSKRSKELDYLFVNFLSVINNMSVDGNVDANNIILNGSQTEGVLFNLTLEKIKTRWIELDDNQCFPSIGKYLGIKNDSDLIFCVNGVEKKLN